MDEDILSDVVPSNIVSRQASHKRSNQLGEDSHSFQPSQGADGESEFDDEQLDELISDVEDVPVRAVAVILASLFWTCTLQTQTDSAHAKKLATAERKEKTKKRKAAEGQLQIKRQEMDKAKASSFASFSPSNSYNSQGRGRRQTLCISLGTNRTFQALCQYQGILALFQRGSLF